MKLGMVGLPNVGKSTLFNALSGGGAESANYPFCTIEPNVGIVSVPDERLEKLKELFEPEKFTPATLTFVDIAGLVKGAAKGEGLGNQFLSHIREVDALIHVVRCFEDENIVHVDYSIDPVRDMQTIELELIFSDLEVLGRRIQKLSKQAKGDKSLLEECQVLQRLEKWMEEGRTARSFEGTAQEREWISPLGLLSDKPVIYAANLSEDDFMQNIENQPHYQRLKESATEAGAEVFPICAKMEQDMADMEEEDRKLFLQELGLEESGLARIIKTSYRLLGLISFLTAGKPEVRAWTIKKGTKAPQAAGKIHSDFERGFIRAEVIPFEKLMECKSMAKAKENGWVRSEGKEYVMQDGDVVLFRFHV